MSNFFARLLNDSSSSDEEERNMWFAAAVESERQNSQGAGSGDRISRQNRHRDRVSGHSRLLNVTSLRIQYTTKHYFVGAFV